MWALCASSRSETVLVSLAERLLILERELVNIMLLEKLAFSYLPIVGVQQLHDYHREAVLLCLRHHSNIGLALTRMACELGRDVILFATDDGLQRIWLQREDAQRREYRERFRFDAIAGRGSALYDLYKLSSQFGVHGHWKQTETVGKTFQVSGMSFIELKPDKRASVESLRIAACSVQLFVLDFLTHNRRFLLDGCDAEGRERLSRLVSGVLSIDVLPKGSNLSVYNPDLL